MMSSVLFRDFRRIGIGHALLLACLAGRFQADANPTGGTVTQGQASFSTSGSQLNINQTSANAFINWQSFNIGSGETVNFNQPSSSSVTWNFIGDVNPSSLNGTLNANGLVVLQNPNGFTVGGTATINAHGLVMTTASTPALNFSSGGPWSFSAPPPAAKIVNYGQINIAGGGSAFLIAADIINNGSITAPGGNIGLYAGEKVLVSTSPSGLGLSAQVTLPQGSVDNEGHLIADAGSIAAQAQYVNQNGVIQANSVQNNNGTIELVASDSLALGANSQISAKGDSTATGSSPGGFVVLNSGNSFADTSGSAISVAGNSSGQGGIVEIFGNGVTPATIHSTFDSYFAFLINPYDLTISSSGTSVNNTPFSNPNFNVGNLSAYSQIDLWTLDNIELSTTWILGNQASAASLSLSAGNNITFDGGTGIQAGQNWSVSMNAGTSFSGTTPVSGSDGIYLNGASSLQTYNGGINLWAANEILLQNGGVRTIGGGSINVTAEFGGVNTGNSTSGLNFYALGNGSSSKPYYTPFQLTGSGSSQKINFNQSNLGGISTAAGGNVTINAGGDVTSFSTIFSLGDLDSGNNYEDPGAGCFGSQAGNLTINAGGNVFGNFMEINGTGTINAGGSIGGPNGGPQVALSLASGSWTLNAAGNIYLQEVRNPNGVFNTTASGLSPKPTAGYHLFDYSSQASVALNAGDGVYITGYMLPRPVDAHNNPNPVPIILPPTLTINAGAGGVNLFTPTATDNGSGADVTILPSGNIPDFALFPSPYGNLEITTTDGGSLASGDGSDVVFLMSDSAQTRWFDPSLTSQFGTTQPFIEGDDASTPAELNNFQPVTLNISGSMDNISLSVSKFAQISVGGDMNGCSFYGENLHDSDVTSINVGGQIFNAASFNSVTLSAGLASLPPGDLPPGTRNNWDTVLALAVNPAIVASLPSLLNATPAQLELAVHNALLGLNTGGNLTYDPTTHLLTSAGPLSPALVNAMEGTLYVVEYGSSGLPKVDSSGKLVLDKITLLPGADDSQAAALLAASQDAPPLGANNGAYIVGGGGTFNVTASAISLGNSDGILSVGNGAVAGRNYNFLAPYMTSGLGATINVTAGYLVMPASSIAALGGGDVNVTCNGVIPGSGNISMDLGSQDLESFESEIMSITGIGLGIYTTGGGNVNVLATDTINVDSSRIATFNGGNVTVTSLTGDVDAGSGGTVEVPVNVFSTVYAFPFEPAGFAYANGIVTETLYGAANITGAAIVPGNITINTPEGNINADLGGILQESLNGKLPEGPFVSLNAGTPYNGDWTSTQPPVYVGNINLGQSGVIGGTVDVRATGKVNGLLISEHNANVTAQTIGNLTVLAAGTANVSGAGSGSGITIIGAQGVDVSGIGSGALLLGQSVSVNGASATSTLGNNATSTSTSQAAAQQSTESAAEQVASSDSGDDSKKKQKKKPTIRVGRVTVILSAVTPIRSSEEFAANY